MYGTVHYEKNGIMQRKKQYYAIFDNKGKSLNNDICVGSNNPDGYVVIGSSNDFHQKYFCPYSVPADPFGYSDYSYLRAERDMEERKKEAIIMDYGLYILKIEREKEVLEKENEALRKEVKLLKDHIAYQPDGEKFLETLEHWRSAIED